MGVQPPFLYDPVKTEGPRSPYKDFDPKAVTRASYAPKAPRPKAEGPLISFNQHPDSYLILPYGSSDAKPMNPSVKKWVKWMRIIQLVLRCFELLCAVGLLVMMILIKGVDTTTGWIMRIVPSVAIIHTVYGIYHLGRKASGRPPASSASYMLFASFFDVSIIPFYAFSALVAATRNSNWTWIGWTLQNQDLTTYFTKTVFFLAAIDGVLHLVSLAISLYLAVTFHKITKLPPDMNPLEDNLTSRHKRKKSSMSAATTTASEKRLSTPLESKRSSGAAYEDLSRPPTIPFFHTRTQSTTSFSTYKSTPPPSRDARLDLPSRQYQIPPSNSARSSIVDPKRTSGYSLSTPPKRASYTEVPLSDSDIILQDNPQRSSHPGGETKAWYAADSIPPRIRNKTPSPRKSPTKYQPLHQRHDSADDFYSFGLPNPLEANPPTPRHSIQPAPHSPVSPLSEISNNTNNTTAIKNLNRYSNYTYNQKYKGSNDSRDIADMVYEPEPATETFKAKYYGELKAGTPPIMIGVENDRQVSSGNDFGDRSSGFKVLDRREVSGKVAEEGRGGGIGNTWGTRFRKISGI